MGGEDKIQMLHRIEHENKRTVDDRNLFEGREYPILS